MLAQEDAIIFVGSGISRWSGLPSWEALIGELADYLEDNGMDATLVRQEAAVGDLLQAASYGFLKLTQPQIASFIRSASRTGRAVPSLIHQAIIELGPSCFITTNYDDLLEQAYRQHRPAPSEPNTVLNTQLLEQAEIIHAQARQFIFKPHGDARHVDSIVLTREQYRMLQPEGPLSATLNTFKTLLQSRPVLFLGFGLRDPDFLHLRDLLANIYRGGMRDHYAIVADPMRDQEDYWRRHYGIHLIGYTTLNDGQDHSGLLTLLKQLCPKPALEATPSALDIENPAAILALARYAAGCLTPNASERFVIRVSSSKTGHGVGGRQGYYEYEYWPVDRLLREGPKQFILIGEPGAGKSFAMREAVNAIASELQDACLRGELTATMKIPVWIDLKLYNGDLEGLIRGRFPEGISFDELSATFPVSLYLDSYNEMPRTFREDGSFDRQLKILLEAKPDLGLVIGSRTSDGLHQFDLPDYLLSQIAVEDVKRRLAMKGVTIPRTHRRDIVNILQRPFYFRLINRAEMSLDNIYAPGDLYAQFIGTIATRFAGAFNTKIDLTVALQKHAYATLERGSEAFAVSDLEAVIATVAPHLDQTHIEEVANWLVSEEVIIPMRGQRAAFVHQSVTEFLAACELKTQLEQQSDNANTLINIRRWDHVIFLTLGMLEKPIAAVLLNEITTRDVSFALNAARFVQHGGEALVGELLDMLANLPRGALDHDARYAFGRLPFTPLHESALRRLLLVPGLRGLAFDGLAKALGTSAKQELIDCLFEEGASWTTEEIGIALRQLIEPSDFSTLLARLVCADVASLDDEDGVTYRQVSAIANAVSDIPNDYIRRETLDCWDRFNPKSQRIIAALICEIFTNNKSIEGLDILLNVVQMRLPTTLFALYLNVRYESHLRSAFVEAFDDALLDTILHYIDGGDRWSIELLEACSAEEVISDRVHAEAKRSSGIRFRVLEYCATGDPSALLAALEAWSTQGQTTEEWSLLKVIDFSDLNWSGYHDLFISLLALHNPELSRLILGGALPPNVNGLESIDMGNVEQWLNWIIELDNSEDSSDNHSKHWVASQLAVLAARSSAPDNKAQIFRILDEGTAAQKLIVAKMVLPYVEGLSICDFSSQALVFLKDLVLQGYGSNGFKSHVFGMIADEVFLRNELVPLAEQSTKAYDAVATIVHEAGKRLGIRLALPKKTQVEHID